MKADRIEFLRQKQRDLAAALAKEIAAKARHDKRDLRKLDLLLGSAVRIAGAQSADFRLMIGQTALANVGDEKLRAFLARHGWL